MIRRASAAVILPLVAFLHGFAYYGTRSVQWVRGDDAGVDGQQLVLGFAVPIAAGVVGAVAAGALGALIGPSGVAAVGLAVAAAACLLPPTSAGSLLGMSALMGFGAGLCRPALYAAAGRPWRATEGAGVAVVLVLAWVGFNGAAAAAAPAASWLYQTSPGAVGPLGAAVLAAAAALAATDAGIQWLAPSADPPAAWEPRAIGVGFAVAVVLAGAMVVWSLASNRQYDGVGSVLQSTPWLEYLNPVAVIAVGLLLALVLGVAVLLGARVPPLLVAGVGFAVLGAVFLVPTGGSTALVAAAQGLGGAAEVVALPLAYAAVSRGVHWRLSTAALAIPFAVSGAASVIFGSLVVFPAVGVLCGLALLLLGVALAVVAIPLDRWLLAEEPPPPA